MPDSPTERVAEHVRTYVETNGQNGYLYRAGQRCYSLTTRSRKSGRLRRTTLIYGQGGD